MTTENAINSLDYYPTLQRQLRAKLNNGEDAAALSKFVEGWVIGTIFFRVLLSIVTLGIAPLIHWIRAFTHNKDFILFGEPDDGHHINWNFVTEPYHETQTAIEEFKQPSHNNSLSVEAIFKPKTTSTKEHQQENLNLTRLRATLLKNGTIFSVDYSEKTDRYYLNIYQPDDLSTPKVKLFESANPNIKNSVFFKENNNTFIFYSDDKKLYICSSNGKELAKFEINGISHESVILPVSCSVEDGKIAMSVFIQSGIQLHHHKKTRNHNELESKQIMVPFIQQAIYNPKANRVLYVENLANKINLMAFKPATENSIEDFSPSISFLLKKVGIAKIALSDNAELAALALTDGRIQLYAFDSQACIGEFKIENLENENLLGMRFMHDDQDIEIITRTAHHSVANFAELIAKEANEL